MFHITCKSVMNNKTVFLLYKTMHVWCSLTVVVYTAPKETKISTPETKTKRQWELWSSDDKDAFFEALFEVCIPKSSHHTNDMLYWRTFLNNMALCLALTRKHHELLYQYFAKKMQEYWLYFVPCNQVLLTNLDLKKLFLKVTMKTVNM